MQGAQVEIFGQAVILRPYLRHFVEKYHSWMVRLWHGTHIANEAHCEQSSSLQYVCNFVIICSVYAGGPCPARAYSLRAPDIGGMLPTYLTLSSILRFTDFPHSLSIAKGVTRSALTALCVQEEYAMQASWIRDEQSKNSTSMIGDQWNLLSGAYRQRANSRI